MIVLFSPLLFLTGCLALLDVGVGALLATTLVKAAARFTKTEPCGYRSMARSPTSGSQGYRGLELLRRTRLDELPQLLNVLVGGCPWSGRVLCCRKINRQIQLCDYGSTRHYRMGSSERRNALNAQKRGNGRVVSAQRLALVRYSYFSKT